MSQFGINSVPVQSQQPQNIERGGGEATLSPQNCIMLVRLKVTLQNAYF